MTHPRILTVKLLQKTKLNRLAHRIYYNHLHGFSTANKDVLPTIEKCFQKLREFGTTIEGDYYEFGVFKGYAFWYAQRVADSYGFSRMKFFGFDSFSGLPEIQESDKTKDEIFYEGQYACTKEEVIRNLESRGIDWERTFLIEGFFEKSLNDITRNKYKMKKIAIVLIDCDLYSSTAEVLNFIASMMKDKTILIFDDWNCFDKDNERGQRKAFREFLKKNRHLSAEEFISYGLYGQTFIMNQEKRR